MSSAVKQFNQMIGRGGGYNMPIRERKRVRRVNRQLLKQKDGPEWATYSPDSRLNAGSKLGE